MTLDARSKDALEGIYLNLCRASELCADVSADRLRNDWARFYAVTRCLEIISEASRRVSDEITARHPSIPWQAIRNSGNIYRHAYSRVLEERVLTTVRNDFDQLEEVVRLELGLSV